MAVQNTIYVLDSKQRNGGGSIQNATYNMVSAGTVESGTYELVSFQSQNVYFNVEAKVNDEIYFDESAAELGPVNLTPGSYTAATLIVEIKAVMDAVSGSSYTVTYDAATNKITAAIAAGTFAFNWGTNVLQPIANQVMGYTPVDGVLAASQVGDSQVDLSLYENLILDISEDSQQNVTLLDGSEHSLLIPLRQNFAGEVDSLRNETYSQTIKFGSTLNSLNVQLFMDDGSMPLNNAEYILIIRKLF